jgi:hypothetical protein
LGPSTTLSGSRSSLPLEPFVHSAASHGLASRCAGANYSADGRRSASRFSICSAPSSNCSIPSVRCWAWALAVCMASFGAEPGPSISGRSLRRSPRLDRASFAQSCPTTASRNWPKEAVPQGNEALPRRRERHRRLPGGRRARSRRGATSGRGTGMAVHRVCGGRRRHSSSGAPMSGCLRAQSAVCSCMRSM